MMGHNSIACTRGLLFLGVLVTVFSLMSLPASAVGQCKQDAGGGCERDGIACAPSDAPPANGKCYTVKQERILKCLCLVNKPAGMTTPGTVQFGHPATPVHRDSDCREKCEHQLINCAADAKTLEERNRCFQQHQSCIEDCTRPTSH